MATTGQAWTSDEGDPEKWTAWFDPDAVRDIPFHWEDWLADIGSTYASHSIIVAAGLECVSSSQSAGVIKARIRKAPAGTLVVRQSYSVICRITAVNGEIQDQTVYLRIIDL